MKTALNLIILLALFSLLAAPAAFAEQRATEGGSTQQRGRSAIEPHEAMVFYKDRRPEKGTPHEAMVRFIILRETGKREEAEKLISKKTSKALRRVDMRLAPEHYGKINIDTVKYQLIRYAYPNALVRVDFKYERRGSRSWTRDVIFEDGKWVVYSYIGGAGSKWVPGTGPAR